MHLLSSLSFISCTPQGANIVLVGITQYSLSAPVDGEIKFQIIVTSQHTYKCTGIISHTTTNDSVISPSLLKKGEILQIVFSIDEVKHHINCTEITPISIEEYNIDESGNKQSVSDAIEWYKEKNCIN